MFETINIKFSGKTIKIKVRRMNFFGRFLGLMFRTRNTDNLLFDFGREINISIHSLFVFFPFLAIWLDSKNNVIDAKVVKPFCLSIKPDRSFRRIIEIPFRENNLKLIDFLTRNS